ncbi:MAG: FAD-dependent oxidoreductase [Rhodospirillales bacterium]|nr:FAD-dependent oxidoreductase [Rhodospirillales bacterium]MBT4041857.1 FAD-dependent oxidoreductase [Rhodospirillales bacterium]MBT4626805.1 FAD-dependent oxidoreductase [Rhodospirillales bacterium]MBT5351055.1 FAD-dependent oxidoreductase [Rhodospirillales bacterium]MBT5521212.1 FAD-dependent oxidoreductase [Rhodospirillales bacterium]
MSIHKRVVIVGGGNMGVGLLYHLAEAGWTDIVLLEKGELTSGSTWHAAGLCPSFIADYNMSKIHHYGNTLYPKLEEMTGQYVSWHGCGSIRFATNEHELDYFRLVAGITDNSGAKMEIIDSAKIKELVPWIELDGVVGGAWTPEDGHVDPAGVCNAMAIAARNLGAEIVRECLVTDIQQTANGEWEVSTEKGSYTCEHVVNAGGNHAGAIGAWTGISLPISNMKHQYIVTDTCAEFLESDGEMPVIRDPRNSSYYRQEQKSALIGPYETAGSRMAWPANNGIPDWSSDHELFEEEFDPIMPFLEGVMEAMPIWAELGVKTVINGSIPHTPDDNPLLGPVHGLKNYWLCCGSAIGIAQGAGCGKYLAQWIMEGEAEINMAGLDPRRFGTYADEDYCRARGHQAYEHMYTLHLPGEERPAARNNRCTPLFDKLNGMGAVHTEAHGWERPKWFSLDGAPEDVGFRRGNTFAAVAEECRAVRERVGIMDLSSFAKFDVCGPDAENMLNHLTANKVPKRAGGIGLMHMLTENGCIESEVTVTRLADDRFYVLSGGGAEEKDWDMMTQGKLNTHDATITNVTDDYGLLVLGGPKSRDVLSTLTDSPLDNDNFRWLTGQEITVAGVAVRALRVSYVGELGWELHVPMAQLETVYDALWQAGQEHGIANFGAYALNSMRMEKSYRGLHSELTNEITLIESDMERFFAPGKDDDFVGREATLQRKQDGISIKLAYVEVDATDNDVVGGEPVFVDGKCVGVATSGSYGHYTQKSLAFVYAPPECTTPGFQMEIGLLGERRKAVVLEEPVYDPASATMRV